MLYTRCAHMHAPICERINMEIVSFQAFSFLAEERTPVDETKTKLNETKRNEKDHKKLQQQHQSNSMVFVFIFDLILFSVREHVCMCVCCVCRLLRRVTLHSRSPWAEQTHTFESGSMYYRARYKPIRDARMCLCSR